MFFPCCIGFLWVAFSSHSPKMFSLGVRLIKLCIYSTLPNFSSSGVNNIIDGRMSNWYVHREYEPSHKNRKYTILIWAPIFCNLIHTEDLYAFKKHSNLISVGL